MNTSKTVLTLALSSLFIFSGCQSDSQKTEEKIQESPKSNVYTLAQVSDHNTPDDCWTVVNGKVADVTSFFGAHPGGDDKLAKACGKDATSLFESVKKHDPKGYAKFNTFTIGVLAQ